MGWNRTEKNAVALTDTIKKEDVASVHVFGHFSIDGQPIRRRLAGFHAYDEEVVGETTRNEKGELSTEVTKERRLDGGATLGEKKVIFPAFPGPFPPEPWEKVTIIAKDKDDADHELAILDCE